MDLNQATNHNPGLYCSAFSLPDNDPFDSPNIEIKFQGDIKEGFQQLVEFRDSTQKLIAARSFASHYFGLVPHCYPIDDLVCSISSVLDLEPLEAREIATHARVLYEIRRRYYTRTVTLTLIADHEELMAGIEAFLAAYWANPGVKWILIIKAPHGAGKNQICLRRILEELRDKIAVFNHRRALCSDTATSFNLQSYLAPRIDPGKPLVCCINSVSNDGLLPYLFGSRVIYADEASQVLDEMANRRGTIARNGKNEAVLNSLAWLIQRADVLVLADADLDDWTVEQYLKMDPDRQPFIINQPFTDQGRTVLYGDYSQVRRQIKEAILTGHKALIVSDSVDLLLRLKKQVEKWMVKGKITGKTVIVNSKKGYETVNDPEVKELLADINGHVEQYHVLLSSPTISSGVSLTKNHFTSHFFLYRGVIVHATFHQMMLRSRCWKECYLGLYGMYNPYVSTGELIAREVAAERYKAEVLEQDCTFNPKDELALLYNQRDARRSQVLTNPPQALLMLLEARHYKIKKLYSKSCPDSLAEVRRLNQEEFRELVRSVGAVSAQDIRDIQKKLMNKTREESLKLISYEIHACLNLKQYEYLTDAHFDLWNDGRLAKQKARLQRLYSDRDEDKPAQLAVLKLLTHAGIDFETGEGVVTDKSALKAWYLMKKNNAGQHLVHVGLLPPFKKREPQRSIAWLSDFLEKFWLTLESTQLGKGEDRGGRVYHLNKGRIALCEAWLKGEPIVEIEEAAGDIF